MNSDMAVQVLMALKTIQSVHKEAILPHLAYLKECTASNVDYVQNMAQSIIDIIESKDLKSVNLKVESTQQEVKEVKHEVNQQTQKIDTINTEVQATSQKVDQVHQVRPKYHSFTNCLRMSKKPSKNCSKSTRKWTKQSSGLTNKRKGSKHWKREWKP
jgi:DNA repair ATPase RecN